MKARTIRRSSAVVLLAAVLLCSAVATASAIGRDQVLARGRTWIDHPVAYSQSSFYGGWRTDCSGYVSMCWSTSTPGYVTATIHDIASPIPAAQLKPGDVLLWAGHHVRLFVGWADPGHTAYVCWEQTPPATKSSVKTLALDLSTGYVPYRYSNIRDSDTIPPSTLASVEASYNVISTIRLVASDNSGGSGVAHTYYRVDGGTIREGCGVNVRAVGSHTIEYWSVDRMGNDEALHKRASFVVNAADSGRLPVFRFYNTRNYSHFYTAVGSECDAVVLSLWDTYQLDGVAYQVDTGNVRNNAPLNRFRNKINGSYLYSASQAEHDAINANLSTVFSDEGVSYQVCVAPPDPPAGAVPVYRFLNFKRGTYFYTASETEKVAVQTGMPYTYRLEGVAFYLAP